jgi:hypothetical protein
MVLLNETNFCIVFLGSCKLGEYTTRYYLYTDKLLFALLSATDDGCFTTIIDDLRNKVFCAYTH